MKKEWHGKSHTPEYTAYRQAKSRCRNPKATSYKEYGGRGIEFLFSSFAEWYAALGARPSATHSVNRIDNDGDYAPGNVEWDTKSNQLSNRRPYAGGRKGNGYRKHRDKFMVQFCFMRKNYYEGVFLTEKQAKNVYNKKIKQLRQLAEQGAL